MDPEAYDSRARVAALLAGLKDEGILPAYSGTERRSGEATRAASLRRTPANGVRAPRTQRRENVALDDESEVQRLRELLHIVVAYCNGATQEEIALTCGMHVQTVRARLRSAGVQTVRARRALADADIEEIRRLHHSGQSARQLARRYGVAHTTVLRYVQQASIDVASAAHAASVLHHCCAPGAALGMH
ncbi:helix-turn-helix domain-containing protein [Microbacterium lacticum]|nr:helix-turn-helix domain-containing protein [Microbacterium lacticum]